jgi:hypothetical protein
VSVAKHAHAAADVLGGPRESEAQLNEQFPRLDLGTFHAMNRGFGAGILEGVGDVADSFLSPLGIAATLSGVGAERAALRQLPTVARALRGVKAGTGAAFGARGLEQAYSAPTVGGKAMGVAQGAAGALGLRAGTQGFLRTGGAPVVQPAPPVGYLRAAPGYVAGEHGPAARFGEAIPMEAAPDGSYVRAVPGEWAKREIRGYLDPVRGFVADEAGNVLPTERAGELAPQAGRILTRP